MGAIVVGTDGSRAASRALRWAVREAELRHATIEIVHCYLVHDHGAPAGRRLAEATLRQVVDHNREVVDRVAWDATVIGVSSVPSAGLISAAADAELLVVGSSGASGERRLRLGSTAYRTAVRTLVPVAVIPIDGEQESIDARRSIVVGIDDSAVARRALRWAVDEARLRAVDVVAVHVEPLDDRRARSRQPAAVRAGAAGRGGVRQGVERTLDAEDAGALTFERVASPGTPAAVLLEWATADQVLVIGARGRRTDGHPVFGSVSHHCIHHSTGPVVVVP